MNNHTVHIEAAGGNMGCTEKLSMALLDFILVLDKKRYRFSADKDGNLTILCINGVKGDIDVSPQGYKQVILSVGDATYDLYEKSREEYGRDIEIAKTEGCKGCRGFINNDFYKMCSITGQQHSGEIEWTRLSNCPFAFKTEI